MIAAQHRRRLSAALPYAAPVALLALLAALVRWHGQLPYPDPAFRYADYYRYIALAQQPFGSSDRLAHQAPFCWRLLTPVLIHWLYAGFGVPILAGFWALTVAGLVGATLALEWVLRLLGLPRGAVVAGGLAFVLLGPATGFALWAYTYNDPVPLFLLMLMLGCALTGRGAALLPLAALGVLAKETTLLGVLFALGLAWTRQDRRLGAWALGAGTLGAVILLLLRHFIPSPVDELGMVKGVYLPPAVASLHLPALALAPVLAGIVAVRLVAATVGTWSMLLPVALLQRWHAPAFWRKERAFSLLLAGATAQIFVALDVERLVAYGAPAMIAACCWEVETLAQRWQVSRWTLWLPLLAIQAGVWLPYAGWPAPANAYVSLWLLAWPYWVLAGAICAVTAYLLVGMPRRARRRYRLARAEPVPAQPVGRRRQ